MSTTGTYTCTDYRQEMMLLGLKRQMSDPSLTEAEKQRLAGKIRRLEQQMGMD